MQRQTDKMKTLPRALLSQLLFSHTPSTQHSHPAHFQTCQASLFLFLVLYPPAPALLLCLPHFSGWISGVDHPGMDWQYFHQESEFFFLDSIRILTKSRPQSKAGHNGKEKTSSCARSLPTGWCR